MHSFSPPQTPESGADCLLYIYIMCRTKERSAGYVYHGIKALYKCTG